jgi:hypothetical protein
MRRLTNLKRNITLVVKQQLRSINIHLNLAFVPFVCRTELDFLGICRLITVQYRVGKWYY